MSVPYIPTPQIQALGIEIKRLNRFRLRGSLVTALFLTFIVLFSQQQRSGHTLKFCGSLLIAVALLIRLWALGSIDGNKKNVLVSWGPYRYLRHPLYFGSLLFALGACLLVGSITAALVLCLALPMLYLPALRAEERYLSARHGAAWDAYCRETGMLLPRFGSQLPKVKKPFHLRRPLRDIGTLVILPMVVFGISILVQYLDRLHNLPNWFR